MTRFVVIVLVIANVVTAIGVVSARHEHRQLFVQLARLEHARDELNIDFGSLQLEQATWAEANRTDQLPRTRLGLTFPETADIVVNRPCAAGILAAIRATANDGRRVVFPFSNPQSP